MPASWPLVHHTLLYVVDAAPGCRIGSGKTNILAAISKAGEAFIGDAGALIKSIGAGMAEAAVFHVPTVEARATGKGGIPGKWVKSTDCAIVIYQGKELLRQLDFFCRQWGRRAIGRRA